MSSYKYWYILRLKQHIIYLTNIFNEELAFSNIFQDLQSITLFSTPEPTQHGILPPLELRENFQFGNASKDGESVNHCIT